jgi:hypothetical protein
MSSCRSPEWRLVDALEDLLLPRINARDPDPRTLYTQLMCVGGEWLDLMLSPASPSATLGASSGVKVIIRGDAFMFLEGVGPFFPKVNVNDKPNESARTRPRYEVGFAICAEPIQGALADDASLRSGLNAYAEQLRAAKAAGDAKLRGRR